MKTIAIIPIKKNSKRVKAKNFKIVSGKPLYRYLLDKIHKTNFDEIYIDSDSEEIQEYALENNYKFILRDPTLAQDSANGNHLLCHHQGLIESDIYFQLFVTSPLLKISSINSCIKILKEKLVYNSILTSKKLQSWVWFENNPVNYDPKILPRSQDAKPVIIETTGLYGIRKNELIKNKSRIGSNPYFFDVSDEESIDIDNHNDFDLLEKYIQSKN